MSEFRRHFGSLDFLYDEKFEIWLNLTPLIQLCGKLYDLRSWELIESEYGSLPLLDKLSRRQVKHIFSQPQDAIMHNKVLYSISPLLPSILINTFLRYKDLPFGMKINESLRTELNEQGSVAIRVLDLQLQHLLHNCTDTVKKDLMYGSYIWKEKLHNLPALYFWSVSLSNWFNFLMLVHKRSIQDFKYEPQEFTYKYSPISAIITKDLMWITIKQERFICHQSLFLECHNKLQELATMLLFNWLQDGTSMPSGHFNLMVDYMSHCVDKVLAFKVPKGSVDLHIENQGFLYLKSLEGIGVAEIIRRTDKLDGVNDVLWRSLWNNLNDDNIVAGIPYWESDLFKLLSRMPIPTLADALGTVKVCGHPSIEVEEGLKDLYKKTHESISVNNNTVQKARGMMIRELTKNFYNKHKYYPKFKSVPPVPAIKHILSSDESYKSDKNYPIWKSITLDQWNECEFGKNAEFDYIEDGLTLLKDKAACRTRASLIAEISGTTRRPREETKVLLQFLMNDDDKNTREYLDKYMSDEWSDDVLNYLVIKLTAKELEFKYKGRFFGASPIYERNRRIIQESNLTRLMANYIPDQLLTPPELTMIKKLMHYRTMRNLYPDSVILNISFDFSSWNNRMRSDTVDVAANVLDGWFGVKLYGKTMKAFQNAMVIYQDGKFNKIWYGQDGGIEGLNQATWSWVFIGGMRYALEKTGFKYQITVKGDDVRAALVVPNSALKIRTMNSIKDEVMHNIQELCAHMGWKLNPNECYISRTLMSTSKSYFVNDVHLPNATKKFMRSEGNSNIPFPTMEDTIGTCFSIAHSVCYNSTSIFPAYLGALMQSVKIIHHAYKTKYRHYFTTADSKKDFLCIMLCWPQVIGGPGSLPLQTFLVRGENDMLSVSISLMRYILNHGSPGEKSLVIKILNQSVEDKANYTSMLLGDPYSIPLKTPPRPQSLIKQMMRKALRRITKQADVKQLLEKEISISEQKFKDSLLSMEPYYPKVATTIWECSPFFLIEQLLAKFLNSTTIISLFLTGKRFRKFSNLSYKTLRLIVKSEINRKNYWLTTLTDPVLLTNTQSTWFKVARIHWLDHDVCTTRLTRMVRCNIWGRELHGITYPSLVDQGSLMSFDDVNDVPYHNARSSLIHLKFSTAVTLFGLKSLHYANALGNETPWLGHTNSSGLIGSRIQSDVITPPLGKVLHLMEVLSVLQCLDNSNITTMVIDILNIYTDIPIAKLSLLIPLQTKKDNMLSKLQINSYSRVTMPNYKYNLGQIVRIDDYYKQYTIINLDKRTINHAARHFFAIGLSAMYISHNFTRSGPDNTYLYSFHMKNTGELCDDCFELLQDSPINIKQKFIFDNYTTNVFRNKLVRCGEWEKDALTRDIQDKVIKTIAKCDIPMHLTSVDNLETLITTIELALNDLALVRRNMVELQASGKLELHHLQTLAVDLAIDIQNIHKVRDWSSVSETHLYRSCFEITLRSISKDWLKCGSAVWHGSVPYYGSASVSDKVADMLWLMSQQGLLVLLSKGFAMIHPGNSIKWMHNMMDDKYALAECFIRSHWNVILSLLENRDNHTNITYIQYNVSTDLIEWLRSNEELLYSYKYYIIYKILISTSHINECLSDLLLANVDLVLDLIQQSRQVTTTLIYAIWINKMLMTLELEDLVDLRDNIDEATKSFSFFSFSESINLIGDGNLEDAVGVHRENIFVLKMVFQWDMSASENILMSLNVVWLHLLNSNDLSLLVDFNNNIPIWYAITQELSRIRVIYGDTEIPLSEFTGDIKMTSDTLVSTKPSTCNDGCSRVIDELSLGTSKVMKVAVKLQKTNYQEVTMVNASRIMGVSNKAIIRYVWLLHKPIIDVSTLLTHKSLCIVFGDGGGSVSRLLLELCEGTMVIYSGLMSNKSDVYNHRTPLEMLNDSENPIWSRLMINHVCDGDILQDSTYIGVRALLRTISRPVRLIICDADFMYHDKEEDVKEYVKQLHSLIINIMSIADSHARIIIRISHVSLDYMCRYIMLLKSCIIHMHIYRCPYTHPYDIEWFLIIERTLGDLDRMKKINLYNAENYMIKPVVKNNVETMLSRGKIEYCQNTLRDMRAIMHKLCSFDRLFEYPATVVNINNQHVCNILLMLQNMLRPELMMTIHQLNVRSVSNMDQSLIHYMKSLIYSTFLSVIFAMGSVGSLHGILSMQWPMLLTGSGLIVVNKSVTHTKTNTSMANNVIRQLAREAKKSYVRVISWLVSYTQVINKDIFYIDPQLHVESCCRHSLQNSHGYHMIAKDNTTLADALKFELFDDWLLSVGLA